MDSRKFPFGTVLTVAFGRLLAPIETWYEILDFMTGDKLMTHQLARVNDLCRPYVINQYPELNPDILRLDYSRLLQFVESDLPEKKARKWVEGWVEDLRLKLDLPQTLDVAPLPEGVYRATNPLADLAEMIDPERIIVVGKDKANA